MITYTNYIRCNNYVNFNVIIVLVPKPAVPEWTPA